MGSLKNAFTWAAKGIGLIALTELLIFTLVHTNPAWMGVMMGIAPHINSMFDATGITSLGYYLAGMLGTGPTELATNLLGGSTAATSAGVSAFLPSYAS